LLSLQIAERPAFDEVEFWPDGDKLGTLRGLCPDCAATMNRRVSVAKLRAAAGDLRVSIRRADSRRRRDAEAQR
jgi:hypothetical protein